MSYGALTLKAFGTITAAQANVATLAQPVALNNVQAASITTTLAAAPKAGNTLIAWLNYNAMATLTPPAGFTQIATVSVSSSIRFTVWAKQSDGTEQSATCAVNSSRYLGMGYAEWTGSGFHATVTTGGTAVSSASNAFGPSSPPVTNAVPFALFGINAQPTSPAVSSGWTGDFFAPALAFSVPGAATLDATPSGSVSGNVTYGGNAVGGGFSWAIVWMKP